MTMRTTDKTVTFHRPFLLKGVDRELPPADYRVVTDEELIEGLSFAAYRRVSTVIFVPAPYGGGRDGDHRPFGSRGRASRGRSCTKCSRSNRVLLAPQVRRRR